MLLASGRNHEKKSEGVRAALWDANYDLQFRHRDVRVAQQRRLLSLFFMVFLNFSLRVDFCLSTYPTYILNRTK